MCGKEGDERGEGIIFVSFIHNQMHKMMTLMLTALALW